jgi:hypothetical protein
MFTKINIRPLAKVGLIPLGGYLKRAMDSEIGLNGGLS